MSTERRTSGQVTIAGRESADGLTLVTSGLSARGLPEIRVTGLPPYLGRGWARLLAVLAFRLAAHPGGVPDRITLTPDDLRTALGEPAREGWTDLVIGLVPDGDHLTPVPPPGHGTPSERWHADLVSLIFPSAHS